MENKSRIQINFLIRYLLVCFQFKIDTHLFFKLLIKILFKVIRANFL